jgi:signal peptidase I
VVVTHRITRIADANGDILIETKGDANAAPDPAMQAASAVTGVVHGHLPFAGYLLAFLAMRTGILSAISLLGSILMLLWLLEDLEAEERLERVMARPALVSG